MLFLKLYTHTVELSGIEEEGGSQRCVCGGFKQGPAMAVAFKLSDPESRPRIRSSDLASDVIHQAKIELFRHRGISVVVAVNFFEPHEVVLFEKVLAISILSESLGRHLLVLLLFLIWVVLLLHE